MRPKACALAIAGLDPSGGAGVFADLRAFAASSAWGCGAVTLITIQSTAGAVSSRPVETRLLLAQIREIYARQNIRSIKIGALGSVSNARAVARWLRGLGGRVPIVLDPVMRSTRGKALLLPPAGRRVVLDMMKYVTVVTPNAPEAATLLGTRMRDVADAERAAIELTRLGARAALVKGGHLVAAESRESAIDVLAVGRRVIHLRSRRVKARVHGTGCALSSLIAGRLARETRIDDDAIVRAVRWAKTTLANALLRPLRVGDGLAVIEP